MAGKEVLNTEKDYTKEELRNLTLQNLTDLENQTKKNNKKPSLLTLISEVKAEKVGNEPKVETQTEVSSVSMDNLKKGVNSEIFKELLNSPLYDGYIGEKLSNYPESSKENIKVVFWNLLVNRLSSTDGLIEKIGSKIQKVLNIFKNSNDSESAKKGLNELGKELKPNENTQSDLDEVKKSIDLVMQEEIYRIGKLSEMGKNINQEDFKKLSSNPIILKSFLEKGIYINDSKGIKIDINTLNIKGNDFNSTKEEQDTFIKETIDVTNNVGDKAKSLEDGAKKIVELADSLGFKKEDIKKIIDDLSSIPIIGIFLKLLFGGLFKDLGLDAVENSKVEEPRKVSLENLINFQKEQNNKQYLPDDFKLEKEEDVKKFDTFFNTINFIEESRISTLPENEKVNKTDEIIKGPNFWKEVLIGTDLVKGTMMFKIHEKVKLIMEKVPKPKMQQFIEEINNINPDEIKQDKVEATKDKPSQTVSETNMNQTPNPVIPAKTENTNISSAPVLPNSQDKPKEPKPADPKDSEPVDNSKPKSEQSPKPVETVKLDEKPLSEQLTNIQTNPLYITYEGKVYNVGFSGKNITIGEKTFGVKIDLSKATGQATFLSDFNGLKLNSGKIFASFITYTGSTYEEPFTSQELEEKIISLIKTNKYVKNSQDDKNGIGTTIS